MFNKTTHVGQRFKLIREHQIQKNSKNAQQRRSVRSERKLRVAPPILPAPKTLWSHLVFTRATPRKMGRYTVMSRTPTVVNGLFNQVFALFTAADLARRLGRQLIVANFYIQFNVKQLSVPVSKVIQLSTLLVPTSDWDHKREPIPSSLIQHIITYPSNAAQVLQMEQEKTDLEIGCCLLFPLPGHTRNQHIQRMRFHPIFYELVSSFLQIYPIYQVVHYRMENDFTGAFFRGWQFPSLQDCRSDLFQKYEKTLAIHFDPTIPTLVVSHYYKDPNQPRDHDLRWANLIHFSLSPQQKAQLCQHLQVPSSSPMREVDAIIDFILCTTTNVRSFIGCANSTFSESVGLFRNYQNCFLINPHKSA